MIFIVSEWPDYTSSESDTESEVETIVGGKDDTPDHVEHLHSDISDHHHDNHSHGDENHSHHSDMDIQEHQHKKTHKHTHSHHGRSRNHSTSTTQGDTIPIQGQGHVPPTSVIEEQTAHKILNLLSELGHSNLVDRSAAMEEQFHPCKYCKGRLQVL